LGIAGNGLDGEVARVIGFNPALRERSGKGPERRARRWLVKRGENR
jgi:hypothetical protein